MSVVSFFPFFSLTNDTLTSNNFIRESAKKERKKKEIYNNHLIFITLRYIAEIMLKVIKNRYKPNTPINTFGYTNYCDYHYLLIINVVSFTFHRLFTSTCSVGINNITNKS